MEKASELAEVGHSFPGRGKVVCGVDIETGMLDLTRNITRRMGDLSILLLLSSWHSHVRCTTTPGQIRPAENEEKAAMAEVSYSFSAHGPLAQRIPGAVPAFPMDAPATPALLRRLKLPIDL